MSLLIKALNKADEVQAEKAKKTQTVELELESSATSTSPSKSQGKTSLDMEFLGPADDIAVSPTKAPGSNKSINQPTVNQTAAKNAANVFTAKGAEAKTDSTRLALIAGAGLIALLGMGLYFYQFVDTAPPIVVPPRPLEQLDNAAQNNPIQNTTSQNPPVQTAAIEAPVSVAESIESRPEPAIEQSLPPALMPAEAVPVATRKKIKKIPADNLFSNDDEATEIAAIDEAEVADKNAMIEDSLADNEEDVSRLEASFSANKGDKKTRKSKKNAAIASESASISVTKSKTESGVSPILMSAYEAYNAGKDSEAQKLYKQVLKRDIQNVDALLGLGAIAARQGRSADANSWYGKVLELEPRNNIAKAFMLDNQSQGNEQSNETNLKNMLAKQPNDANLHVALGNLYAEQNQWPAAQQAYFDAFSLNKTAENAYNLAVSLDQMGKPKLALPYYQRALEQAGDSNNIDKAALQARITAIQ